MFAQAARRLAGLSGVLLGWSPDTFWHATPEELATVIEALRGDAVPADAGVVARLREAFPDG
jgi:uncharacterized phage protein (TIGR02216 family)